MNHSFVFPGRAELLGSILDHLETFLLERELSSDFISELRLVAEESLTNVIEYAYGTGHEGDVEIALEVEVTEVRLVLRDRGRPFNPLEHPPPDLDSPVEDRPVGGLGIHLMRTLTDEQRYSREGDENVLVLIKRR